MYLRQSTASQEVQLGKFVDDTDFKTAETALTIANTDIKIFKEGATSQANKNSGGATHMANGWYYCVLDATDTNTIGTLEITVDVAGALSVTKRLVVLDEAVYDVLFGTTALSTYAGADTSGTTTLLSRIGSALTITSGRVNADLTHVNTTAWTSSLLYTLSLYAKLGVAGVVTTGATTTSIPTSSLTPAASVTDQFKGRVVIFDDDTTTAALRGQASDITASTAGGTLTVTALTTAPASGDTFRIV